MTVVFKSVLASEFQCFLDIRKTSRSKSCYEHDKGVLLHFDRYLLESQCASKELTEADVTGWVSTLYGKTSSIANKVIIIRKFIEFLRGHEIRAYAPYIPKVHDDYSPYLFSDDEISRIFAAADFLVPGKSGLRYTKAHLQVPMILRIMYGCGTRIGETLSLQMKDVDLDGGMLILRHSKGDKQRIVPMHPSLTGILRQYCMACGIIGYPAKYLFGDDNGRLPIPVSAVRHRFNRLLKASKISLPGRLKYERGPCLHCFRHLFAFKSFTQAQANGQRMDDTVPYLSIYLGHDSLEETQKYLKFSAQLYPETVERFECFTDGIFPEVDYED